MNKTHVLALVATLSFVNCSIESVNAEAFTNIYSDNSDPHPAGIPDWVYNVRVPPTVRSQFEILYGLLRQAETAQEEATPKTKAELVQKLGEQLQDVFGAIGTTPRDLESHEETVPNAEVDNKIATDIQSLHNAIKDKVAQNHLEDIALSEDLAPSLVPGKPTTIGPAPQVSGPKSLTTVEVNELLKPAVSDAAKPIPSTEWTAVYLNVPKISTASTTEFSPSGQSTLSHSLPLNIDTTTEQGLMLSLPSPQQKTQNPFLLSPRGQQNLLTNQDNLLAEKAGQATTEQIVASETKQPSTLVKTPGGTVFNPDALTPAEKAGQTATEQIVASETALPNTLTKTATDLIFNSGALTPAERAGQAATEQVVASETLKSGTKSPSAGSQEDPFVQAHNQNMTSEMGADNSYLSEFLLKDPSSLKGLGGLSGASNPALPSTLTKTPTGPNSSPTAMIPDEKTSQAAIEQIIASETKLPSTLTKAPSGLAFNPDAMSPAEKIGQAAIEQIIASETKLPSTLTKTTTGLTFNEGALTSTEKAGQAATAQTVASETKLPSTLTKTTTGLTFNEGTLTSTEKAGQAATAQIVASETKQPSTLVKTPDGTVFNEDALSPAEKAGQAANAQIVASETKQQASMSTTPSGSASDASLSSAAAPVAPTTNPQIATSGTQGSASIQDQLFTVVDYDFPGESDGMSLGPTAVRKSSDGTVVATPYSSGNLLVGQGPRFFNYGYTVSDGTNTISGFVDVIPIGQGIFAAKTDGFGDYRLYSMKTGNTPIPGSEFAGFVVSMQNGVVTYRGALGNPGYINVSKYIMPTATPPPSPATVAASPSPAPTPKSMPTVTASAAKAPITPAVPSQGKSGVPNSAASPIPSATAKRAIAQPPVSPSPIQQTTQAKSTSPSGMDAEAQAILLNAKKQNQALVAQQQQLHNRLNELNQQQILQTGKNGVQLSGSVQTAVPAQSQTVLIGVPSNAAAGQQALQGFVKGTPSSATSKVSVPAHATKAPVGSAGGSVGSPVTAPSSRQVQAAASPILPAPVKKR